LLALCRCLYSESIEGELLRAAYELFERLAKVAKHEQHD